MKNSNAPKDPNKGVTNAVFQPMLLNYQHSRRVKEWPSDKNLLIVKRSVLGSIRVYNNLLPQRIVDCADVSEFQRQLTRLVRDRILQDMNDWKSLLSPRHQYYQKHPLLSLRVD